MPAKYLAFRTAWWKYDALQRLVDKGRYKSLSDGLDDALTILLEYYGLLPEQQAAPEPLVARAVIAVPPPDPTGQMPTGIDKGDG